MNKYLSRYFFYYPATLLKCENIYPLLKNKRLEQWQSIDKISDNQLKLVRKIISYAKKNSIYYETHFKDVNPKSICTIDDLSKLPSISKETIVNEYEKMKTNYSGPFETKTTGGSTGQPVSIYKNANALAHERASTWRSYEWANISIGESQGRFWGIPHTKKDKFRARLTDLIANRKRINAFNLTKESLFQYYNELAHFKPAFLYGYVSVIEALAIHVLDNNLSPLPSVKSIITTSEVLYPHSRVNIEKAFNVKVFNEYGCGEVGSIAHECESGNMHIMAENMIVETSDSGEIVITDLYNYKMPLIRYHLGDFGELSEDKCSCGRGLPILNNIYGRAYDFLQTKSGKKIHPESLIYVFEDFKSKNNVISQFQAVQSKVEEVELHIISKEGWTSEKEQLLLHMMTNNVSKEFKFRVIIEKHIERERSGKMRLVVSKLGSLF